MEQLLKQLLGQDNAMRSHAEQTISELETQPERYHDEFDECTDPFGERLMDVGSSRINLLLRP